MLLQYAGPIVVITVAVVVGKVLACSLGTFVAGNDRRTSLRVGMGLAQIGEFSFIIAALGLTLKVTSDFLYPIAVAVSAITTLLTPYLIRASDPLSIKLAAVMPQRLGRVLGMYGEWLRSIQPQGEGALLASMIRRILLQVGVNLALVVAIFLSGAFFAERMSVYLQDLDQRPELAESVDLGRGVAVVTAVPHRRLSQAQGTVDVAGRDGREAGNGRPPHAASASSDRRSDPDTLAVSDFPAAGSLVGQYSADQQVAGADRRSCGRCGGATMALVHSRAYADAGGFAGNPGQSQGCFWPLTLHL